MCSSTSPFDRLSFSEEEEEESLCIAHRKDHGDTSRILDLVKNATSTTESSITSSIHHNNNRNNSTRNPSPRWWKHSKQHFRILAWFLLAILGLPGNIYVIYFYYFKSDELEKLVDRDDGREQYFNSSTVELLPQETNVNKTNFSSINSPRMFCYEDTEKVDYFLTSCRFWIEGVLLGVIGTIGLIGNAFK